MRGQHCSKDHHIPSRRQQNDGPIRAAQGQFVPPVPPQQLLPGEVAPAPGEQLAGTLQAPARQGGQQESPCGGRRLERQFPLQGIGSPAALEVTINGDK